LRDTLLSGDNLGALRRRVADASVDLAYLDPPFNSGRDYGAFADTWAWDRSTRERFDALVAEGRRVGALLAALREVLGPGDRLAHLAMMAPRLAEVRRVLRPTGSVYLHCDPTASHALKLLMDAAFGPENFRSEVVWKRSSAHNRARRFGPVHDVLLHYARSAAEMEWHPQHVPYGQGYKEAVFRRREPDGRRYRVVDLTSSAPGYAHEWRGCRPPPGRYWAHSADRMDGMDAEGRLHYTSHGNPKLKRYLDEMRGVPVQDVWTDIVPLSARSAERVGYPTQKPEALLERIVRASSSAGGVVLDPFCGSGTALAVAHRLGRRWIGVDSSPVAIRVTRERLARQGADHDVVEDASPTEHSLAPAQG
jgi:site-specific DNA-methyltransferase (adenine-specific)